MLAFVVFKQLQCCTSIAEMSTVRARRYSKGDIRIHDIGMRDCCLLGYLINAKLTLWCIQEKIDDRFSPVGSI